jgi:hypothetical protein
VCNARRLVAAALAAGALLAAPDSALAARLSGGGMADISQVAMTVAVTDSDAGSAACCA